MIRNFYVLSLETKSYKHCKITGQFIPTLAYSAGEIPPCILGHWND